MTTNNDCALQKAWRATITRAKNRFDTQRRAGVELEELMTISSVADDIWSRLDTLHHKIVSEVHNSEIENEVEGHMTYSVSIHSMRNALKCIASTVPPPNTAPAHGHQPEILPVLDVSQRCFKDPGSVVMGQSTACYQSAYRLILAYVA